MDQELRIQITANLDQFSKAMDGAVKKVENAGKKLQSVGKDISTYISLPIAAIGTASVMAASDAEEAGSKFRTIFRDIGDEAEAAFTTLREQYGLSSNAARELLGNTGDLLTGFGFTQGEALRLSEEVNKLAVDLASFTNFSGGAAGASEALTKALLGERDSVKALGISIMEEDVTRQMAINSANGMTFATERQAKAQATLDLAIKQSGNAIGDYSRTSQSFANQMRLVRARTSDLMVELGNVLLPVMTKLANGTSNVISAFSGMDDSTKRLIIVIAALAAAIGPLLATLGFMASTVLPAVVTGFAALFSPVTLIVGAIALVTGAFLRNKLAAIAMQSEIKKLTSANKGLEVASIELSEALDQLETAKANSGTTQAELQALRVNIKLKLNEALATHQQIQAGLELAKQQHKNRIAELERMGASADAIEQTKKLTGNIALFEDQLQRSQSSIDAINQRIKLMGEDFSGVSTDTENASEAVKTFESAIVATDPKGLKAVATGFSDIADKVNTKLKPVVSNAKNMISDFEILTQQVGTTVAETFAVGLTDAFTQMLIGGENAFQQFGKMIQQLIARLLVAAAVAALLSALLPSIFGTGGTSSMKGFGNLFGSLAGIGPVGGSMGGSANMSNLTQGGAIGGGAVQIFGTLSGSDILLSNEREGQRRTRRRGF